MTCRCKGTCERYKPVGVPRTVFRRAKGIKYCGLCAQEIVYDGLYCPCCGQKMRLRPKAKKYRDKIPVPRM